MSRSEYNPLIELYPNWPRDLSVCSLSYINNLTEALTIFDELDGLCKVIYVNDFGPINGSRGPGDFICEALEWGPDIIDLATKNGNCEWFWTDASFRISNAKHLLPQEVSGKPPSGMRLAAWIIEESTRASLLRGTMISMRAESIKEMLTK